MGNSNTGEKVKEFFKGAAIATGKGLAKIATTVVGAEVPVVGPILAAHINSLYKKGGRVKVYADGGEINGHKTVAVNSEAQLIKWVKRLPTIAEKVGLSVSDIKEGAKELKEKVAEKASEPADVKKRGGRSKHHHHSAVSLHHGYALGGSVGEELKHHQMRIQHYESVF